MFNIIPTNLKYLEEVNYFLEKQKLPKLTEEENKNLNIFITTEKI